MTMPPPLPPEPPPFQPVRAPFPPGGVLIPPKKSNAVLILVVVGVVVLSAIGVISVLAAIAVPQIATALKTAQAAQSMANARQLYLATMQMVTDHAADPNPALGWPGDLAVSKDRPITTQGEFVERLVEFKYLKREDLARLFHAQGVPAYRGVGDFDSEFSPFKIYKVTEKDAPRTLFLSTRNFWLGSGLDGDTKPFGSKVGVVCLKDGTCRVVNSKQAENNELGAMLPGQPSGAATREETEDSTLD